MKSVMRKLKYLVHAAGPSVLLTTFVIALFACIIGLQEDSRRNVPVPDPTHFSNGGAPARFTTPSANGKTP